MPIGFLIPVLLAAIVTAAALAPVIVYGPAGRANLLDVYRPRTGAATGPCLVYFHGGGYLSGRKNREARALIYRLASLGWVCVSANYQLARAAPYPAQLY